MIDERLKNIESLLLSQKTVLNFDEVAAYTGLSKSYLHIPVKLNHRFRSKLSHLFRSKVNHL